MYLYVCFHYLCSFFSVFHTWQNSFEIDVATGEKDPVFCWPFHWEVKVQSHTRKSTIGGDHFSVLSEADDANMELEQSPSCPTIMHHDV